MSKKTDQAIEAGEKALSQAYNSRWACDVLEEMRQCVKTHNYAPLSGLIEEAQSLYNRLENAVGDKKAVESLRKSRSTLKDEIKRLVAKLKKKAGKDD